MAIFDPAKLRRAIDVFMMKFVNEHSETTKKLASKTHDPILFAIDHHFIGSTFDWNSAAYYQAVKQNRTNAIGDLHEVLIDLIPDWKRLPHGSGQPDIVNMKRKILIEVKAREDTVKGSDLPGIYDNLKRNLGLAHYSGFTGIYGHVLNKARKIMVAPDLFTPSDSKQTIMDKSLDSKGKPYNKRRHENSKILRVDGALLWSIILNAGGSVNPPYSNPNALQHVYDEVFKAILAYKSKVVDPRSLVVLKDLAIQNFTPKTPPSASKKP